MFFSAFLACAAATSYATWADLVAAAEAVDSTPTTKEISSLEGWVDELTMGFAGLSKDEAQKQPVTLVKDLAAGDAVLFKFTADAGITEFIHPTQNQ